MDEQDEQKREAAKEALSHGAKYLEKRPMDEPTPRVDAMVLSRIVGPDIAPPRWVEADASAFLDLARTLERELARLSTERDAIEALTYEIAAAVVVYGPDRDRVLALTPGPAAAELASLRTERQFQVREISALRQEIARLTASLAAEKRDGERYRLALVELVACKALKAKRDDYTINSVLWLSANREYNSRKELAWAAARAVIAKEGTK